MDKKLTAFFLLVALFFSCGLIAAEEVAETTNNTSFFQGLWDFIDWIYEVATDFKNSVLDFLMELISFPFYVWIKMKIATLEFIWGLVLPIIQSLNLADVVNSSMASLPNDIKAFIGQSRIVEGINMLISAKLTKLILNLIGW